MKEKFLSKVQSNPIFYLMLFLGFAIFGCFALYESRFTLFPSPTYPGLSIRLDYPGVDALQIEEIITTPIEEVISTIGGIREIRSTSEAGKTLIQVEFMDGVDLQFKALELREKIDLISSKFPREAHKPMISRYDPEQVPILIANFHSENLDLDAVREQVEKSFKAELENIDGISQVIIAGGRIREINVGCDPNQLEAFSISLREVLGKLQESNLNSSMGEVREKKIGKKVLSYGKFKDISEIRDLPISIYSNTNMVLVDDISKVSVLPRDEENGARWNAENRVSIYIYKNYLGNPLGISRQVHSILESKSLHSIAYIVSRDLAEDIRTTIYNLCFLFFLVLIVLGLYSIYFGKLPLLFLSILGLLPTYLVLCLTAYFLRLPFDTIFHFGFFLGFISWYFFSPYIWKIREDRIVAGNVFSFFVLWVLLLAVPFPVFLFDVSLGKTCFLFAFLSGLTFLFNLLFFPILFQFTGKFIFRDYYLNSTFLLIVRIGFRSIYYFLLQAKEKFSTQILENQFLAPVSLVFLFLLGLYSLFQIQITNGIGSDRKEIIGFLEFPSGTGFEHTNKITLDVEKKLLAQRGVKEISTRIDPGHSLIILKLNPGIIPNPVYIQELKNGVGSIEQASLFFSTESEKSGYKEITLDVLGDDWEELHRITNDIAGKVKSIDGVKESVLRFKPPREELQLILDGYKILQANLTFADVGDQLRLAIQGGVATKYLDLDREVDVRVRFAEEYRKSENSLGLIRIKNSRGRFVPIMEISSKKEAVTPLKVYHKNKKRSLSFTISVDTHSIAKISKIIEEIKNLPLPENYRIETSQVLEETIASESSSFWKLPIVFFALIIIYFSIVESISQVWIVFGKIFPYAIFFVFFLSFLFGDSFETPFFLGIAWGFAFSIFLIHYKMHVSLQFLYFLLLILFPFILFAEGVSMYLFHFLVTLFLFLGVNFLALRIGREWKEKFGDWRIILKNYYRNSIRKPIQIEKGN